MLMALMGEGEEITKAEENIMKVQQLFDKSKCFDIFEYTKVENYRMYPKKTLKESLFLRFQIKKIES